jgi:hypothetical protein
MIGPESATRTWTTEITITSPDLIEPHIGPGMILEKGRERIAVSFWCGTSALWACETHKRKWFGRGFGHCRYEHMCVHELRELIASGFKIIRPADTEEKPNA